jgi:hypothetical protein
MTELKEVQLTSIARLQSNLCSTGGLQKMTIKALSSHSTRLTAQALASRLMPIITCKYSIISTIDHYKGTNKLLSQILFNTSSLSSITNQILTNLRPKTKPRISLDISLWVNLRSQN